jgi:hypothetical protein
VIRGVDARIRDVRGLLAAARAVHANRAVLAPDIARATGLTLEGVELGFRSLELEATDAELRALIAAAGSTRCIHVILSANVFVAPLRAVAMARAAADHVTVRPSRRDPVLARALVQTAGDGAIDLAQERDVAGAEADEIHVYGSTETIAAIRARAPSGAIVRGHGPGMGIAWVTRAANVNLAAAGLAADVLPFDQRGCLSPRVAIVEGTEARAEAFAGALDASLRALGQRVPRGGLTDEERVAATHWRNTLAFAGRVWEGNHHAVALAPAGAQLVIPPPGRHIQVVAVRTADVAAAHLASIAHTVVAVGTDDQTCGARIAPQHARVSALGQMQHPPLDGPVDLRRSV